MGDITELWRLGANFTVVSSGTSQTVGPVSSQCRAVRISTQSQSFVEIGKSPVTASAAGSSLTSAGGFSEIFAINPGESVAVIWGPTTAAGVVTVTELY
jgi:hypothetical protein